jgi:actin-like ATPase involved in cell morphogenesis
MTMGYLLGIDLGTTFTAAAIARNGRVEMVSLGVHTSAIPSLVFMRDDEEVLVGEPAGRRGVTEPARLAREFKRRMGDTAPIMLGTTPYSPERLTAALLRFVIDAVATQEGGPPDRVAITYPANWGPFKVDVLRGACRLAEVPNAILLTEPFAAAVHYASTERVDPGDVVAVYDLGGGTFDAAVLRKRADGWEQLGRPEGIEHLGGVDFDEAVLTHVRNALGPALDGLDQNDPTVRAAMARLAADCVAAKEALSSDSDATISVILPNLQTEIRITRGEFEAMIRPTIRETVEALRRALTSAQVEPKDLKAVLLVGGSSRIPLVGELVRAELVAPVSVDAHPKHAVALGAAQVLTSAAAASAGTGAVVGPTAPVRSAPAAGGAAAPPRRPVPPADGGGTGPVPAPVPAPAAASRPATAKRSTGKRKVPVGLLVAIGVLVVVAIVGGVLLASGGGGDGGSTADSAPSATAGTGGGKCTSESGRCALLRSVRLDGNTYIADYTVKGFEPVIYEPGKKGKPDDHHVHFFFDTIGADRAGTNTPNPGIWQVWDRDSGHGELRFDAFTLSNQSQNGGAGATKLCILVADAQHGVEQGSGNCMPLPTSSN